MTRAAPPGSRTRASTRTTTGRRLVLGVLVIGVGLLFVLPLAWMLSTSLKTTFSADANVSLLPDPATVDAYGVLLTFEGVAPVLRWFANSVLVAVVTTLLVVATAAAAAFPLARMTFPGRSLVLGVVVGTIFVPGFIFLIPNYVIIAQLGFIDSYLALVLPAVGGAFGVFFLRQFFLSVPADLEEAALLDGADQWQIFRRVLLPLAQPALATLSVLTFLASWNDFLWPVYVLQTTENLTLPAGLPLLQSANLTNYPLIMAGAVIASLPALVVFVIAQRRIIESVAMTGIRG